MIPWDRHSIGISNTLRYIRVFWTDSIVRGDREYNSVAHGRSLVRRKSSKILLSSYTSSTVSGRQNSKIDAVTVTLLQRTHRSIQCYSLPTTVDGISNTL